MKKEHNENEFPLISVVIPTCDRPEWFVAALESVIGQSYKNLDIFVTDDSDNDDTAEKIKPYLLADDRIHYEHHPEYDADANWKRAFAYNNPEAEYVNFLMDDDLWDKDRIRRMLECFFCCENAGLVTSVRRFIDADGKELRITPVFNRLPEGIVTVRRLPEKNAEIIDGRSAVKQMLRNLLNFIGEMTTVLIKKKYMSGGCRCGGISGEDDENVLTDVTAWIYVLMQSDMVYIHEPLSSMRLHKNQDQRKPETILKGLCCWQKIIAHTQQEKRIWASGEEFQSAVQHWKEAAAATVKWLTGGSGSFV